MNNKFSLLAKIAYLTASVLALAFSLYLLVASFTKFDDGYGINYQFNETYLIATFISLSFVFFFIYTIIHMLVKGKDDFANELNVILLVDSCLISFYSLGAFFKALSDKASFVFKDQALFLFIGIVGFFIAAGFLLKILNNKQK